MRCVNSRSLKETLSLTLEPDLNRFAFYLLFAEYNLKQAGAQASICVHPRCPAASIQKFGDKAVHAIIFTDIRWRLFRRLIQRRHMRTRAALRRSTGHWSKLPASVVRDSNMSASLRSCPDCVLPEQRRIGLYTNVDDIRDGRRVSMRTCRTDGPLGKEDKTSRNVKKSTRHRFQVHVH